jgi:hypoxanthine phosphoribosyltransferase
MTKPRGVLEVDWPFFGELCKGLAAKVKKASYEPDLVVGIARAGVVPGAVVASILGVEFASITLKRSREGEEPSLISRPTQSPKGRKVLLVDGTCESGSTMRLALSVMREEEAAEVKTAVAIRTGSYQVDFEGFSNPSRVVLPWDGEAAGRLGG